MEIFNNTTKVVRDDLEKVIVKGSRVSIAAACFSIYAFEELKTQLKNMKNYVSYSPLRHLLQKRHPKKNVSFIFHVSTAKKAYMVQNLK